MLLENIIESYKKHYHLDELKLDSSGQCNLVINDDLIVTIERSIDEVGFFVYGAIGTIAVGDEQKVALMALQGNLFGKETGRSSIGYVEQTRTLVLFDYFELEKVRFNDFLIRFDHFIEHLYYWKMKMQLPQENKTDNFNNRFYA